MYISPYDQVHAPSLVLPTGHTEAAAGVVGLCHAISGLGSTLALPISHLHGVGSHLAAAITGTNAPSMGIPRQQGSVGKVRCFHQLTHFPDRVFLAMHKTCA
jgi:hypothetical protein